MKRTLRIRERKVDVELTLLKILPAIFMVLLILLAVTSGTAAPGAAPPMMD
ncbi:MAG: hypothetical protein ACFFAE_09225 [Candidatus Hodarchaeota archaeon]